MSKMLRIIVSVFVFVIFMPVLSNAGDPPLPPNPMDHLKCYMVKDSSKVSENVILSSLKYDFEEDCKIIGKERFYCEGVNKQVVPPLEYDFEVFPPAIDRVCYRIECPTKQGQNPVPNDKEVEDQFGKRTLSKFNPHYLCTPAIDLGSRCETRAVCGGECVIPESDGQTGECSFNYSYGDGGLCMCQQRCTPTDPAELICDDGRDDDCDGLVDCDDPDCEPDGACADVCIPDTELCDGADNDCDGQIDEDFPDFGTPCDGPDPDDLVNGIFECTQDGTGLVCIENL